MFKNILLSKMTINHYFLFKFVIFLNKDKFLIFVLCILFLRLQSLIFFIIKLNKVKKHKYNYCVHLFS